MSQLVWNADVVDDTGDQRKVDVDDDVDRVSSKDAVRGASYELCGRFSRLVDDSYGSFDDERCVFFAG